MANQPPQSRSDWLSLYRTWGASVIPAHAESKKPFVARWGEFAKKMSDEDFTSAWSGAPQEAVPAIICGVSQIACWDADCIHGTELLKSKSLHTSTFSEFRPSKPDRLHVWVRSPGEVKTEKRRCSNNGCGGLLEFRCVGSYTLAPPGERRPVEGSPLLLSLMGRDEIDEILAEFNGGRTQQTHTTAGAQEYDLTRFVDGARAALVPFITKGAHGGRHDLAHSLVATLRKDPYGLDVKTVRGILIPVWEQNHPEGVPDLERIIDECFSKPTTRLSRTFEGVAVPDELKSKLSLLARAFGITPPPRKRYGDDDDPTRALSADRTDAGNALRFAESYADRLKFDHRRESWVVWRQHWWEYDATGEAMENAKQIAHGRFINAARIEDLGDRKEEATWAIASHSRPRLEAMLALSRSDRRMASKGDDWDADAWSLGVANGIVDLRLGMLRQGKPDDGMTMHTSVEFDPKAKCPRWEKFIEEVFGPDEDLRKFIKKALGYSLTGITSEQVWFLCWGEGSNGKSTLLRVMEHILGDYHYTVGFQTFERQQNQQIPSDVAKMVGKRFIAALETTESAKLNEGRIKALTGQDKMSARHLYGEFFEFVPVAKLWLAANHRPVVYDDSHAFWRRVRLIPFLRRFEGASADRNLEGQLKAEAPGILRWLVEGCLEWQEQGLEPPAVVNAITQEYRDESDPIADFLEQSCDLGPTFEVRASELWKAYADWADERKIDHKERLKSKTFYGKVHGKFNRRKNAIGRSYIGLKLKTQAQLGMKFEQDNKAVADGVAAHSAILKSIIRGESVLGLGAPDDIVLSRAQEKGIKPERATFILQDLTDRGRVFFDDKSGKKHWKALDEG